MFLQLLAVDGHIDLHAVRCVGNYQERSSSLHKNEEENIAYTIINVSHKKQKTLCLVFIINLPSLDFECWVIFHASLLSLDFSSSKLTVSKSYFRNTIMRVPNCLIPDLLAKIISRQH